MKLNHCPNWHYLLPTCHTVRWHSGQTKPVRIIRLVSHHTVEEMILARAARKRMLTDAVIEDDDAHAPEAHDLKEMVKFGAARFVGEAYGSSKGKAAEHVYSTERFERLLGGTCKDGKWLDPKDPKEPNVAGDASTSGLTLDAIDMRQGAAIPTQATTEAAAEDQQSSTVEQPLPTSRKASQLPSPQPPAAHTDTDTDTPTQALPADVPTDDDDEGEDEGKQGDEEDGESTGPMSMNVYLGTDYTVARKLADQQAIDALLTQRLEDATQQGHTKLPKRLRSGAPKHVDRGTSYETDDELEAQLQLKKRQRADKREATKHKGWAEMGYMSLNLPMPANPTAAASSGGGGPAVMSDYFQGKPTASDEGVEHVVGDATKPSAAARAGTMATIILHAVDNSGDWINRGMFAAINRISPAVQSAYEDAAEARDLHLGDAHAVSVGPDTYVVLVCCQRASDLDKTIVQDKLKLALMRVAEYAQDIGAGIHMSRLGHSSKSSNWYGVERTIEKQLASKAPVKVYHYVRSRTKAPDTPDTPDTPGVKDAASTATSVQIARAPATALLPAPSAQHIVGSACLHGVRAHVAAAMHGPTKAKLERIIVAWGGEVTDSLTYHTTHWVFEHSDDFHDVVAKHEQTNASASLSPEPEKITVEQFLAKLA